MKKILIGALVVLLAVYLVFNFWKVYEKDQKNAANDYFYMIYSLISDIDFSMGTIEHNTVSLYSINHEIIQRYELPQTGRSVQCLGIVGDKLHGQIFFIIDGSVDDRSGVVFSDNEYVYMEGLHSVERLGGNSFYFKTYH